MAKAVRSIDASEKETENAVLEYLRYQIGILAFKVNTMGVYDQRGGFYRKLSKYVMPGTPDVIACVSVQGIPVFVGMECKAPKRGQSKDQINFQEVLQDRAHGFYFVIKSVKDAEDAIKLVRQTISARMLSASASCPHSPA